MVRQRVHMARIRLNAAQQQGVEHDLGPLLVLAGAGSGKTGVVTQRIARLIGNGVTPRSILAVTFTNKAAAEMHERIVRLTGAPKSKGLMVCTFHRFGLEVLSRELKALGIRGGRFAIFDRGDSLGVLRETMRNTFAGKNFDFNAILNRISMAKNAFLSPDDYAQGDHVDDYDELTALAYPRYCEALSNLQAFDFDDLVVEPVRLWQRRQDVRKRWQQRFRYLIVDEYQDTNKAQLAMLRTLTEQHQNICVVGDDDQAIYAWRGADVRNILDFEKHYPKAKVVKLEHNYRSRAAILSVANALLAGSQARRHDKTLIATKDGGDIVQCIEARDATTEAQFVVGEIKHLIDKEGMRPGDFAILYRSNLQSGEFEGELRARGLPFRLFGGTQVFERKEVKDVLAYMGAALTHHNELAVRRCLNYPPRGIGDVAFKKLVAHATLHDLPLYDAIAQCHAVQGLSAHALKGCREYLQVLGAIEKDLDAGCLATELVDLILDRIQLKRQLWAECGQNNKAAARRWGNVAFMQRAFERHDNSGKRGREALTRFLQLLMLREESKDESESDNKITLTTMHGAKGLEFRYVFVVGVEEGFLPHARSTDERITDAAPIGVEATDEIEQERRLFYVAITRAMDRLYLCRALARPSRGKLVKRVPSRFLLQIPEELYERREILEAVPPDPGEIQQGAADVLAAIFGASD